VEVALEEVGISANKNAIPFDPRPPRVTSGLRLGTPAITSRGFKEDDAKQAARLILRLVANLEDEGVKQQVADDVKQLTTQFPVPGLDL
jgi:glycine hydroxymethyltransferase